MLRVVSRVTYTTSESEMKETMTYYRFYGLNIFRTIYRQMLRLHKILRIS
jgi:hypothetical protein